MTRRLAPENLSIGRRGVVSVNDLSAPFANFLLPVLPVSDGVCPVCHSDIAGTYGLCFQCNAARAALPERANAISFVALAAKHQQLARDLFTYKSEALGDEAIQVQMSLAALLWRWLRDHESCLANAVGVTDFSVVTSIPSLRATHPLKTMVGDMIAITKSRYEPLLKAGPSFNSERVCRVDMFEVTRGSRSGEPVLVIDDTFTTGSHVQSAAAALKQAGFGPVGVMCIGRHWVKKDDVRFAAASAEYLKRSKALGWNWEYCCLCDSRSS